MDQLGPAAAKALTPGAGETNFEVRVELFGTTEILRRINARRARLRDFTPAWPEIDRLLRAIVAQVFASEGAHGGEPWTPLAASTQADRRRHGYGPAHPILERTHTLERSLTGESGDTISVHHEQYYAFGTAVEYFPFHQRGTSHMPVRRIGLTFDDRSTIMGVLRRHLRGEDPADGHLARQQMLDRFAPTTGGR